MTIQWIIVNIGNQYEPLAISTGLLDKIAKRIPNNTDWSKKPVMTIRKSSCW